MIRRRVGRVAASETLEAPTSVATGEVSLSSVRGCTPHQQSDRVIALDEGLARGPVRYYWAADGAGFEPARSFDRLPCTPNRQSSVLVLFARLFQTPFHLLPHRVSAGLVKSDQLPLSSVDNDNSPTVCLRICEGKADSNHLVRLTGVTGYVTDANRFVWCQRNARAAPKERWEFYNLVHHGDKVTAGDVLARDTCAATVVFRICSVWQLSWFHA